MNRSTDRQGAVTRARVVSLALIALAVLGLAYLRFAGTDRVSVPKGAQAGDLILESCTYATENGGYQADCGTLVVPENRLDPQSRLIALPVTRIKARTEHPAEPVFRLEGGPGKTNMQFSRASRFASDRDVVLVGYRGVDGSSVLDCPEVESTLKHSADVHSEKSHTCLRRRLPCLRRPAPGGRRRPRRLHAHRSGSTTSRPLAWRSATAASTS